jgi:hypothetical protein
VSDASEEGGLVLKPECAFAHGYVSTVAEDEVIDDFDVQQLPCIDDGLGEGDVILGGRRVAAGVVVGECDGEGVPAYGLAEDLRDAGRRPIDGASVEGGLGEDVVLGIEDEQPHFLLLEQLHFGLEQACDVIGDLDARAKHFAFERGAASEFEEGGDGGGFGGAEAVYFAEGGQVRGGEAAESAVFREQATGDGEHVFTGGACAEHDRKQLGGGERTGTEPLEALAGSFVGGKLRDASLVWGFAVCPVSSIGWFVVRHATARYD